MFQEKSVFLIQLLQFSMLVVVVVVFLFESLNIHKRKENEMQNQTKKKKRINKKNDWRANYGKLILVVVDLFCFFLF